MYAVLSANIGAFIDRDDNGKAAILLYDINDQGSINGYYGGYFWNKDYYADALVKGQNLRSNEMDIIYIRGREPSGWTAEYGDFYGYNLTTLVHEYQHLVHFGLLAWSQGMSGKSSDAWIDEMMAMAAETMYFKEKLHADPSYTHDDMLPGGYLSSRIEYYTQDKNNSIRNGHGLTYWNNNGDVLANYALSYLFGQYLSLQATSGQGIFKDILNYIRDNKAYNYLGVAGALTGEISGIGSWEDLLRHWAIANMINSATGLSGYTGAFTVTAHGPTANKVMLNNGGIIYRKLDSTWSPPADAGQEVTFFVFDASGTTAPADTTTSTIISPGETTTTTGPAISTTTTIHNDSTTTTTSAICPFEALLGQGSPDLDTLRRLRDEVLSANKEGRQSIIFFYKHAFELNALLYSRPELREKANRLIFDLLPGAEDLVLNKKAVIKGRTVHELLALIDELSAQASPSLKREFRGIQNEVRSGAIFKAFTINISTE